MCGIIAAFNADKNKPVNEWIINQFEDQKSRGTEGFGLILIDQKKEIILKRATESAKAIVDLYLNKTNMIVMHHRTPSSTPNLLAQTHPIMIKNKILKNEYLIIHNGVISNDNEIKTEHEKLGFKYNTEMKSGYGAASFNDSEALAIETARFIEKQTDKINIEGSAAFIAVQIKKNKIINVFFGKNESAELKLSATRGKIRISSEGEGNEIKPYILYSFNLENLDKLKSRTMPFVVPKPYVSPIGYNAYGQYGSLNYSDSTYRSKTKWKAPKNKYSPAYDLDKDDPYIMDKNEEKIELAQDAITSAIEGFCDCLNYGGNYYPIDEVMKDISKELMVIQSISEQQQLKVETSLSNKLL